jgi:hypothetical protein
MRKETAVTRWVMAVFGYFKKKGWRLQGICHGDGRFANDGHPKGRKG